MTRLYNVTDYTYTFQERNSGRIWSLSASDGLIGEGAKFEKNYGDKGEKTTTVNGLGGAYVDSVNKLIGYDIMFDTIQYSAFERALAEIDKLDTSYRLSLSTWNLTLLVKKIDMTVYNFTDVVFRKPASDQQADQAKTTSWTLFGRV